MLYRSLQHLNYVSYIELSVYESRAVHYDNEILGACTKIAEVRFIVPSQPMRGSCSPTSSPRTVVEAAVVQIVLMFASSSSRFVCLRWNPPGNPTPPLRVTYSFDFALPLSRRGVNGRGLRREKKTSVFTLSDTDSLCVVCSQRAPVCH